MLRGEDQPRRALNLDLGLTRMSHNSSTALRNPGTGADFVGFATLRGVDPASPKGYDRTGTASSAHQREAHTSTRSSFAHYEFCELACGFQGLDMSIIQDPFICGHQG